MIDSHRHASNGSRGSTRSLVTEPPVTLVGLHSPFSESNRHWVDALDPTLPSEPRLVRVERPSLPPRKSHKLVLKDLSLGAGALALGYVAAALLL